LGRAIGRGVLATGLLQYGLAARFSTSESN
jgi:hypothetical protein